LFLEHNGDVSPENDGTIPQLFVYPTEDHDSEDEVFGENQLRMRGATIPLQDAP
jgi:hypothetical protein